MPPEVLIYILLEKTTLLFSWWEWWLFLLGQTKQGPYSPHLHSVCWRLVPVLVELGGGETQLCIAFIPPAPSPPTRPLMDRIKGLEEIEFYKEIYSRISQSNGQALLGKILAMVWINILFQQHLLILTHIKRYTTKTWIFEGKTKEAI